MSVDVKDESEVVTVAVRKVTNWKKIVWEIVLVGSVVGLVLIAIAWFLLDKISNEVVRVVPDYVQVENYVTYDEPRPLIVPPSLKLDGLSVISAPTSDCSQLRVENVSESFKNANVRLQETIDPQIVGKNVN